MNTHQSTITEAEQVFRQIMATVGGMDVIKITKQQNPDLGFDLIAEVETQGEQLRFGIEAKKLVTPSRSYGILEQILRYSEGTIGVIYAPVISPRVANLAKEHGLGYFDAAGNCWIRSERDRLLIERHGLKQRRRAPKPTADPFSPKSSRIVRAMLSEPMKGWQVRQLASHSDVKVSVGLVVNVKRALIEEGYAFEHEALIYLLDPIGLLENWSAKYPAPPETRSIYIRGEKESAEKTITAWCYRNKLTYALAGMSAAWRLAPETRYNVTAVYVEDRGFENQIFGQLASVYDAKQVESGANVQLWEPFDQSVFAGTADHSGFEFVTSPIQTYLDVKRAAGRGEEAALAIFDKYLRKEFDSAVKQGRELQREV